MIIDSILSTLAAHWKASTVGAAVVAGIGLLANEVTSPKVFAVAIFLSDGNALWTWEWWSRTILWLVVTAILYVIQKRKYASQLLIRDLAWQKQVGEEVIKVRDLRDELNHTQLRLEVALNRIDVLMVKKGGK